MSERDDRSEHEVVRSNGVESGPPTEDLTDARYSGFRRVDDHPDQVAPRQSWLVWAAAALVLLAVGVAAAIFFSTTDGSGSINSPFASSPSTSPTSVPLPTKDSAPPVTPNPDKCDKINYYAYDAPEGSNAMGADPHVSTAAQGRDRFQQKLVCDPLWAASALEFIKHGEGFDPADAQRQAAIFENDPKAWQKAIDEINESITGDYLLVDYGAIRYESLGMIPDPGKNRTVMPQLTKWGDQPELHLTLVTHTKYGDRVWRIECDLQPSAPHFEKVTPPPPPPPPACSVNCGPPPCAVNCAPPPCTVNCVPPPCTVNCTPPPCTVDCTPPPCTVDCTPPPCTVDCTPPPCTTNCSPPCPPGTHGTPPVCKDDPSAGPATHVTPQQRPNPLPARPDLEEPTAPAVAPPPPVYAPPPTTVIVKPVPVEQGGPTPLPAPRETLTPQPEAPAPQAPSNVDLSGGI